MTEWTAMHDTFMIEWLNGQQHKIHLWLNDWMDSTHDVNVWLNDWMNSTHDVNVWLNDETDSKHEVDVWGRYVNSFVYMHG